LGFIGGAIFVLQTAWMSREGRSVLDRFTHRLPIIKDILIGLAIGRFVRVLGVTLRAGLGLIEGLQLAARASGRPMLLDDVERMIQQVRTGGRLRDALEDARYFTPFTRRMLTPVKRPASLHACAI